jgi:uncharacterized protein (DUF302 family)
MEEKVSYTILLNCGMNEAVDKVTEALKSEGFGILTKIDVRETFKKKIESDFRPYIILGACNPLLAYKALSADANVGVMLPCNVTVEENIDGSGTLVRLLNPAVIRQFVDKPDLPDLTEAAVAGHQKILNVVERLQEI